MRDFDINIPHTVGEWSSYWEYIQSQPNSERLKLPKVIRNNEVFFNNLDTGARFLYIGRKARRGLLIADDNIIEYFTNESKKSDG